jgi:hypothetical protein
MGTGSDVEMVLVIESLSVSNGSFAMGRPMGLSCLIGNLSGRLQLMQHESLHLNLNPPLDLVQYFLSGSVSFSVHEHALHDINNKLEIS